MPHRNTHFTQTRVLRRDKSRDQISPSSSPSCRFGNTSADISSTNTFILHPQHTHTRSHPSLEYDRSLKWSQFLAVNQFKYVVQLLVRFVVSAVMCRYNIDLWFCSYRRRRSCIWLGWAWQCSKNRSYSHISSINNRTRGRLALLPEHCTQLTKHVFIDWTDLGEFQDLISEAK
jgi:hypothetical protein